MAINIGGNRIFGNNLSLENITGIDTTTKNTILNKVPNMNLTKWVDRNGSRSKNVSYQNTDGQARHIFVLVDFNFNRNSDNVFQISSNNSSWFTIAKTRGMQQNISVTVPDGWWYKFSNGMPVITWIEGDT